MTLAMIFRLFRGLLRRAAARFRDYRRSLVSPSRMDGDRIAFGNRRWRD